MNQFTDHQQKFIDAWPEHLRAIATQNLLNPHTGWTEVVDAMDESEFVVHVQFCSNGFTYPHIGHSSNPAK